MKLLTKALDKIMEIKPLQLRINEKASRMQEQLMPEFSNALGMAIDSDEDQFRRISQTSRDLDPLSWERSINISYWMFQRNGFYKRLIRIALDAIEQTGFKLDSDDEKLQEAWNKFYDMLINKELFWETYEDMMLSGEANWPVGINEINGDMELGYIDPLNIKLIRKVKGNVKIPDQIVMKDKMNDPMSGQTFDIIRERSGEMNGEIFHFTINKPTNASRGNPMFLAVIDHVDVYDQALFNEAERWILMKSFIYDVTRKGSADEDNLKWYKKHFPTGKPPNPGSVRVHNEDEEWKDVSPTLNAHDGSKMANLFRQNVSGMSGYPDFFMGWSGGVNVATAREMTKPTIWMVQKIQKNICKMLTTMFTFQQQQWNNKKHFKSGLFKASDNWKILANNVFPRDFLISSAAFRDITTTIIAAKNSNIIGKKQARKQYVEAGQELGFELSIEEIKKEFEEMEDQNEFPGNGR